MFSMQLSTLSLAHANHLPLPNPRLQSAAVVMRLTHVAALSYSKFHDVAYSIR